MIWCLYGAFLLMLASMAGFMGVVAGFPFWMGAGSGFIIAALIGWLGITID